MTNLESLVGRLSEAQRRGLMIACEGPGADWLPFKPLGSFKSSKGRANEMAYITGAANDLLGYEAILAPWSHP